MTSFIELHRDSTDAELAVALVEHAGKLAFSMREQGLATEYKTSISDVVTDADRSAEQFVADTLAALRPADGLLGEEGAAQASRSGKTWVIDPVDGTLNFTEGSDYFCSALALVEGDPAQPSRILLGAVHRPALGVTWFADCNGATRNGAALPQLSDAGLTKKALVTYLHPTFMRVDPIREAWLRVVSDAATIRMWGAGSVDLAQIASGQMGGWLQHSVKDWDWLPGKALIEAVGGVAKKVDAGGVTWCVAGNAQFVADVQARLEQHDK